MMSRTACSRWSLHGGCVATHAIQLIFTHAPFPKVRIEPDHIYVQDGSIFTTAGLTAGIDLSLAMIEDDFGRQMALDVAKYLVAYLRRAGDQSQFSPLLKVQESRHPKRSRCSNTYSTMYMSIIR